MCIGGREDGGKSIRTLAAETAYPRNLAAGTAAARTGTQAEGRGTQAAVGSRQVVDIPAGLCSFPAVVDTLVVELLADKPAGIAEVAVLVQATLLVQVLRTSRKTVCRRSLLHSSGKRTCSECKLEVGLNVII